MKETNLHKAKILDSMKKNNGIIVRETLLSLGVPSIYLSRLVKDGTIKRVSRGIYTLPDYAVDEFFVFSHLYSKLVYSRETALFLNGLSKNRPNQIHAIFPYGTFVPKLEGFKMNVSRKDTYRLGISMVETPYGNKVPCYDKERSICDLFVYQDWDYEERNFAIREYAEKYMNFEKLYSYAKKLGVYEKVENVFGVIGWK